MNYFNVKYVKEKFWIILIVKSIWINIMDRKFKDDYYQKYEYIIVKIFI